ncbi:9937_t:CDS:2 [Scutellospora calospora]|uniref:9937_t:CDS:1 n=1 Tax=Scutellospora calospora TaxID=85575 RepID=A0ACA9KL52_9GLOM|nr:9937_t:CDS:2 [Scutellospora calospora]
MSKQTSTVLFFESETTKFEIYRRRSNFIDFAKKCSTEIDGFEFEEPIFEKYDEPIKELDEEEIKNVKQLELIFSICESIEKDKNIDKKIKYNKVHKAKFDDIDRVLSSPSDKEFKIRTDLSNKLTSNIKEGKEIEFPFLKKRIDSLPDYIFQRIDLLNTDHSLLVRSASFDFWYCNVVSPFGDRSSIENFFNIIYTIFDDEDIEDLSLIIAMNKIDFDYNQFRKVEYDPIENVKYLFENNNNDDNVLPFYKFEKEEDEYDLCDK